MRRPRVSWLVFSLGALVVVDALAWITWHSLRLEAREQAARSEAAFQRSVQIALWRMESTLSPLLAKQSTWRYFHYLPFYPAQRAYTRMWEEVLPGEVLVPSPLLEDAGAYVRLHFQIEPDGRLTSPQVPMGNMRDQAEAAYVSPDQVIDAESRLNQLAAILGLPGAAAPTQVDKQALENDLLASGRAAQTWANTQDPEFNARLETAKSAVQSKGLSSRSGSGEGQSQQEARPLENDPAAAISAAPGTGQVADQTQVSPEAQQRVTVVLPPPPAPALGHPQLNDVLAADEMARLMENMDDARRVVPKDSAADGAGAQRADQPDPQTSQSLQTSVAADEVAEGELSPLWRTGPPNGGPELLFIRTVNIGHDSIIQGIWINWDQLRGDLLTRVKDVLPGATIEAVYPAGAADPIPASLPTPIASSSGQFLAAIPAMLLPGDPPTTPITGVTPTRAALAVTWTAVLAALGAVAMVLHKSMELAQRRGQFVSAVTHELRTPLTTFCLYTDMLAHGMVPTDEARAEYLGTLRTESQRLSGIVENVLDYARLSERRVNRRREAGTLATILDRVRPPLLHRAAQAGMNIEISVPPEAAVVEVPDAGSLERIVSNLVDNACKYARDARDRRIVITAWTLKDEACVSVRDFGPGVPAGETDKIFQPFHRAARDEQSAQSGLGLGLALARGLARELGGDLRLRRHDGPSGAEFVITLPINPAPGPSA